METIRAYTTIEQSKKLAEILPIETADMWYPDSENRNNIEFGFDATRQQMYIDYKDGLPCWSLAALLYVLEHPRCFQGDKPTYWFCGCFGKDKLYHEVEADNPIDACYKMIVKLHKSNLL